MDKLQWFKFTPSDWMMGKIQKCPPATRGMFINLCCLYWNKECELSLEDAEIEVDEEHLSILIKKKIVTVDGENIRISFLDEQMEGILETSDKRRDAANKRWSKKNANTMQTNASALKNDANAMQNDADKSKIRVELDSEKEKIKDLEVDSTGIIIPDPPKPKRTIFVPPQLHEVQNYCIERQNKVDPEQWHNHYTANGWMVGRSKMKDWKAAVRTWEKNDFNTAKNGATTYTPKTRDQINREESDARRKRIMAKFQPESGSQDQANGFKTNSEMDEGFADWSAAD